MAIEKGNVLTGARVYLVVQGKKIGYARNASWGENIAMEPVEALGNIEVEENVETRYRVNFSCSMVRVLNRSLRTLGIQPKAGTSPEEHLRNIIAQGELSISVTDRISDVVIMELQGAKFTSKNNSVDANSILGTDVEFVGTRILDESEA